MSDEFWKGLFGLLLTVFGIVFTTLQNRTRKAIVKVGADQAAHADEVKDTLAVNTDSTNTQLKTIHSLVNSALGVPLKALALALRRIAIDSGRKEDIDAATLAEKASADHEEAQKKIDTQLGHK